MCGQNPLGNRERDKMTSLTVFGNIICMLGSRISKYLVFAKPQPLSYSICCQGIDLQFDKNSYLTRVKWNYPYHSQNLLIKYESKANRQLAERKASLALSKAG